MPVTFDDTILALPADLTAEQWDHVGEKFHGMTRNVQWWGDWLKHDESRCGQKYSAAVRKLDSRNGRRK